MESHLYLQPPPPQTSSINPHVAVPPGFPLPPKPPLPHSPNLYFLAKLKGNIARCNGWGTSFKRDTLENNINAVAVISGKERCWFPLVFSDSSKCWRMGRSQNNYYHMKVSCLKSRNPNFKVSDLTSLLHRIEGGLLVSNEMTRELWERFGDSIFCKVFCARHRDGRSHATKKERKKERKKASTQKLNITHFLY